LVYKSISSSKKKKEKKKKKEEEMHMTLEYRRFEKKKEYLNEIMK
jgi:hypothetical protein